MKKEVEQYLENLFEKFDENWDLRKEIAAFGKYLNNPDWMVLQKIPTTVMAIKNTEVGSYVRKKMHTKDKCQSAYRAIAEAFKKARRNKDVEQFVCSEGHNGLCYPLTDGNNIFGGIIICGLAKPMDKKLLEIFTSFTDAVIRESQKELELEDLNNTIRPRAIALSTVHTVHRLMGATLDLDELLPRIARLSLQVIRANRCSIKLVGKRGKMLLPKTTVDLRKEKAKLKKVEVGKYAPGRAVKQSRSIRGERFLATPLIEEEVIGVITLYDKLDGREFSRFDEEIMKTLAEQAVIAVKNAQLFQEQQDLTLSSIKCIAQLLSTRPHGGHQAEGSFLKLINIIGQKFCMNESEINLLQYAAMLHDAGQISIPEKVLMKRGELTGEERDIVKKHPMQGASILKKFKPLKPIVPIILYHHENYDGSGYPKGLKGEEIPLAARILGIVASFEAMITDKPYRKALSINAAIKEVVKNKGTQFDPEIVDAFSEAVQRRDVRRLLEKELGGK